MRPVAPASVQRVGYPRLRAAWRLLATAAPLFAPLPAFADATLPSDGRTTATVNGGANPGGADQAGGARLFPKTAGVKKRVIVDFSDVVTSGGVMVRPSLPEPPQAQGKEPQKRVKPCLLHPHDPADACAPAVEKPVKK
ncbi:MAG: hypothetical protein EXR72_05910 [Myxococcales bacterium]|nr:hypothetical protein [Myxococcales bacterium]